LLRNSDLDQLLETSVIFTRKNSSDRISLLEGE
jgi:hypothetical protein